MSRTHPRLTSSVVFGYGCGYFAFNCGVLVMAAVGGFHLWPVPAVVAAFGFGALAIAAAGVLSVPIRTSDVVVWTFLSALLAAPASAALGVSLATAGLIISGGVEALVTVLASWIAVGYAVARMSQLKNISGQLGDLDARQHRIRLLSSLGGGAVGGGVVFFLVKWLFRFAPETFEAYAILHALAVPVLVGTALVAAAVARWAARRSLTR